jgi:pyruvate dehydrogenase E1 component
MRHLHERRRALGGPLPARGAPAQPVPVPALAGWGTFALQAEGKEMSTTMAFVRMLTAWLKDAALGPRIVPIVADEARTFGMANLFRQVGIYAFSGQSYEPEDIGSLMSYREATDGQILEEGISEAGALSSWTAAATAYSVHGLAMLPFYIYYSMFGFQRVGDLIWAAADQRARGFLLGATAGRTTLGGEGLQHQDGSSLLQASTVPNCRAYDPCFAGELALILDHGMRAMLERQEDVFYYVTLMNENAPQPTLPPEAAAGVVKGLYRWGTAGPADAPARVRLVGSGAILREVIAAADLLAEGWPVQVEVWSATSFSELAREAQQAERHNRLHPLAPPLGCHLRDCLAGAVPVVAASDSVRAWPELIAAYLDAPFTALGTDGFGRSDTRAELRRFFEVDRHHIVLAALTALRAQGQASAQDCEQAIRRFGLDGAELPPWQR